MAGRISFAESALPSGDAKIWEKERTGNVAKETGGGGGVGREENKQKILDEKREGEGTGVDENRSPGKKKGR